MTKHAPMVTFASWDACVPYTGGWLAETTIGRPKRMAAGALIYGQNDLHRSFYLIRSGFVQTSMTHESGRSLLLELMGPGSIFGEGAAFDQTPRYVEASAIADCELTAYVPSDIRAAGSKSIELLESLVKIMAAKQRILATKLLQFSGDEPEARLRNLLARLVAVQRRAAPAGGSRVDQVWISQEQLGAMCGMSRISAARALRRLAGVGLISTHPKYVEVIDAEGLSEP